MCQFDVLLARCVLAGKRAMDGLSGEVSFPPLSHVGKYDVHRYAESLSRGNHYFDSFEFESVHMTYLKLICVKTQSC